MTDRWYWFLAVLMEQDTFDDLNLRTAATAGPGYEFIEKGDFANPYFSQMTLQGDIGAGFWNEDRKIDNDDSYGVYRWSLRWEWEVIPKLTIFTSTPYRAFGLIFGKGSIFLCRSIINTTTSLLKILVKAIPRLFFPLDIITKIENTKMPFFIRILNKDQNSSSNFQINFNDQNSQFQKRGLIFLGVF